MRPYITFYVDEVYHSLGAFKKHPTIYIITYIEGKGFKRVIIDEGSTINMVSKVALQNLNILMTYLNSLTLAIRAFNNTFSTTLGVVVIPIKIGVRLVPITCHIVESEMQYNILLG